MKPKFKIVGCKCVQKINKQLDPQGLELDSRISMTFGDGSAVGKDEVPIIALAWTNKKKRSKPPILTCSFCPFCGKMKP